MSRRLAIPAFLLLGLVGCSSVYDLAGGTDRGPQVFGGVRTYPEYFADMGMETRGPGGWDNVMLLIWVGIIDIPCSLVADIVLLPVTGVAELLRPREP